MSQVIIKTNSFHVTDETKYRKLIKQLIGETQDIRFRDMVEPNGKKRHSFAAFSEIKFLDGKHVSNLDRFFQKLREILLSNEAVICMKLFNEEEQLKKHLLTLIPLTKNGTTDSAKHTIGMTAEKLGSELSKLKFASAQD